MNGKVVSLGCPGLHEKRREDMHFFVTLEVILFLNPLNVCNM